MCYRDDQKGAKFSEGVMEALAAVHDVTVVATYIKPPPLPALPAAMEEIEELQFPHSPKNSNQKETQDN